MPKPYCLALCLSGAILAWPAAAQTDSSSSTTSSTTTSSTTQSGSAQTLQQQQQAIQQQITDGITSGTLSDSQLRALQAQQDRLNATQTNDAAQQRALGPIGIGRGETTTAVNPQASGTRTGPDPFTYNTLGPDAYQAQKYQNPAYNVPAYPTTNPQSPATQQQYTQPSAGTPYGAGYAQPAQGATGGVAGSGQGVYVYRPSWNR
jgi:hypothetical protein